MKLKTGTLLIFVFLVFGLYAQSSTISSHIINWKGVSVWRAGTSTIQVISFDSAQYPMSTHFPYFNQRVKYDPAFSYIAELKNTVLIPLTAEENKILSPCKSIPADTDIKTQILSERGTETLNVQILPFVKRNGNIMKLLSFDLQISKASLPQKTAAVNNRTYTTTSVCPVINSCSFLRE